MKDVIQFSAALTRYLKDNGLGELEPLIAVFTFKYLGESNIARLEEDLDINLPV